MTDAVWSVAVILGKSHYLLFCLTTAMQPRMLVTFDEDLKPLPVSVRVGQVSKGLRQSAEGYSGEIRECFFFAF